MGALKVWTGSQWTEAGGGLRDVPVGVSGAQGSRAAAVQSIGASWTKVTLDTEDWDTDGYFDNANDRLTIPAGMGGPHFIVASSFSLGSSVQFGIYKNGADWRRVQHDMTGGSFFGPLSFFDPDAVAGDYYELWAYNGGGAANVGHASVPAAESRIGIFKIGSGNVGETIGAQVYDSGTTSMVDATATEVVFDSEEWDSDGFHSTVSNTGRLTIPAGLGGKYMFQLRGVLADPGAETIIYLYKNGSEIKFNRFGDPIGGGNPVLDVVMFDDAAAGDYYQWYIYQAAGVNKDFGHASDRSVQAEATIILLATSGADPGRVRTGTAFPSPGAAWTDRFVRTDIDGIEFTHDGTRWVSTQEYSLTLEGQSGITATNTATLWAPLPASDILVTDIDYTAYVSTAATWTVAVLLLDYDNGSSSLDTYSTASQTGGKLYHVSQSVDTVVSSGDGNTTAAPVAIKPTWTEDTGTATFYGGVVVHYRLIAT